MKVDIQHINKLLDRYMEGENTQEELRELKVYFQQAKDIPDDLLPYKEMFEVLEKPNIIPSAEALESLLQPKQKKKRIMIWPWIAAACVAGLIVMLLKPSVEQETDMPHIAKVMPKAAEPQAKQQEKPSAEDVQERIQEEPKPSVNTKASKTIEKAEEKGLEVQEEYDGIEIIVPTDEPKAYAASTENTDDKSYQDPHKVDEYLAQLASIHNAEKVALNVSLQKDTTQTSMIYVFPDNKEIDLLNNLLHVACWYRSDTPGYYLNFSSLQFIFQLKDMKKGNTHMWQAERTGEHILVYTARVPIGTRINSAKYKEFRQKFIQQYNKTYYKF